MWHSACIHSCERRAIFYHQHYEKEESTLCAQCHIGKIENLLCLLNVTDFDWALSSLGRNWIEWRKLQTWLAMKLGQKSKVMDYNWSFLKHKWGTTISVLGDLVLPNSSDYYLTCHDFFFFCTIIFHHFQSILTDASKTSNFTLVISTKWLYVNQLDNVTLVTYLHHLN